MTDLQYISKSVFKNQRRKGPLRVLSSFVFSQEELYLSCQEKGITLILSHLREQPMRVMKKTGFLDKVGSKNCCRHIEEALKRAENLVH